MAVHEFRNPSRRFLTHLSLQLNFKHSIRKVRLLHAVFNPDHPPPATAEPPHPPPPASSRGAIPSSIFPLFKKLLNPSPAARGSAKHFLEVGMTESGLFSVNRLVKVCVGLDNFAISSDGEKATFLRYLSRSHPYAYLIKCI